MQSGRDRSARHKQIRGRALTPILITGTLLRIGWVMVK
jgi:hypothetical protein